MLFSVKCKKNIFGAAGDRIYTGRISPPPARRSMPLHPSLAIDLLTLHPLKNLKTFPFQQHLQRKYQCPANKWIFSSSFGPRRASKMSFLHLTENSMHYP
jgi:hypothetical protein